MTEAIVPAAAPAPAPAPAPAAPAASEWYGNDAETAAYAKTKGWPDGASAVKSYREAEKLIGRDPATLLVMPRADDPAGLDVMYNKLGRPADSKGYDMTGGIKDVALDPAFAPRAAEMFHKAGLSAAQGNALAKLYNETLLADAAREATDYTNNVKADRSALQNEWRGGFERMMSTAQGAVQALDIPAEAIDGIESKLGYAGTVKLFAALGQKLGEDKFVSAEGKQNHFSEALTPAEAKVAWSQKTLDANFMAALKDRAHPGHKAAVEEQTRLFRIQYPE